MTEQKQYFTTEEMKERIIEILEYYSKDDLLDYHDISEQLNNTYDYIVYYNEAKEALYQYDVFNAIETIKQYENLNFGEVTTDFSCPTQVANMLWYVLTEEYMNDLDLYQYETVGEMLEVLQDEEQ